MIDKIVSFYHKTRCKYGFHKTEIWIDLPDSVKEIKKNPLYLNGKYLKCKYCEYVNVKIVLKEKDVCNDCDSDCERNQCKR